MLVWSSTWERLRFGVCKKTSRIPIVTLLRPIEFLNPKVSAPTTPAPESEATYACKLGLREHHICDAAQSSIT